MMKTFEEVFSATPTVIASAPRRVNLLGEHTDYNGGYVMPTAIPQHTSVSIRLNKRNTFRLYSAALDQLAEFDLSNSPSEHFATYIFGCLREVQDLRVHISALDIHISSDVPMGVGLSSSAALEVAMLRALRKLLNLNLSDVTIAKMAQQAEIKYTKVNCGIMDQMAASLANTKHLLFLDTRALETQLLPLPTHSEILVLDSGFSRNLAKSKYNERRLECAAAAKLLKVNELRDAMDLSAIEKLAKPLNRRARHVFHENNRVLHARKGVSAIKFGQLMNASHLSLMQDYEVSIPELDLLVSLLQQNDEVFGAKLTGAGFGGACVALCSENSAMSIGQEVLKEYNKVGKQGQLIIPIIKD